MKFSRFCILPYWGFTFNKSTALWSSVFHRNKSPVISWLDAYCRSIIIVAVRLHNCFATPRLWIYGIRFCKHNFPVQWQATTYRLLWWDIRDHWLYNSHFAAVEFRDLQWALATIDRLFEKLLNKIRGRFLVACKQKLTQKIDIAINILLHFTECANT